MNLLKKYGPALAVTLALIIVIWLVFGAISAVVRDRYYGKWVMDEAGLISRGTEEQLCSVNRELDEKYGSVVGLITVKNLDGRSASDYAYTLLQNYGFGQNDILILLAQEEATCFVADGDAMALNYPNSLRIALQECINGETYQRETADSSVLKMYETAVEWYFQNVPEGNGGNYGRHGASSGTGVVLGLLLTIIAAFALLTLFRYVIYPIFRYPNLGEWKPLWGKNLLEPLKMIGVKKDKKA